MEYYAFIGQMLGACALHATQAIVALVFNRRAGRVAHLRAGKALLEGIIIEPQLANFFLRRLLGAANFVDDMVSLDPQLYRSLISLKRMGAHASAHPGC